MALASAKWNVGVGLFEPCHLVAAARESRSRPLVDAMIAHELLALEERGHCSDSLCATKARSTFSVMRDTVFRYPFCERQPHQVIDPTENTAPPWGPSK